MPYSRPTLTQLRTQARSDAASLTQNGVLLRFANLGVAADVLAGLANGEYGYLDYIALQCTPFTATALEVIAGWAALKNVFQKQPQAAALQVSFDGTANVGVIPAGTSVVRLTDSVAFTTAGEVTVNGSGVATVTVVAVDPGSDGNTAIGTAMVLGAAISGVQAQGVAGTATVVGVDLEDPKDFRTRMLEAYATPPQGGDVTDYVQWAESVAGVTRAWCFPQGNGPGTVVVYFMMDTAEAAHGGFPQGSNGVAANETRDVAATGDQLAVANYIFTVCNVNALVYAYAPSQNTITITITGLSNAGAAVQSAIQAAVAAVFLSNSSPGGVRLTDGTTGGEILLSDITDAIGSVSGSSGYVISAIAASAGAASPTSNITSNAGALPTLADIVFA